MATFNVTANYARTDRDGWTASGQVPTFMLTNVVSEQHARKVAADILTSALSADVREATEFYLTAVEIPHAETFVH